MPIVEIDGIGRVELGGEFMEKSPQERDAIIQEIANQIRGSKSQAISAPKAPDTSFTSAFMSGIDAPLENLALLRHPDR